MNHQCRHLVGLMGSWRDTVSTDDEELCVSCAGYRIEELEAKIVALIKAGDRVAAACEVLARKLNDCTNEDLAEAVAAWTAWRQEAKSDG